MIQLRSTFAALAAALALASCVTGPEGSATLTPCGESASAAAPSSGGLSIKPLQYTCKQLPNGLRIYAMPDKDTASVSVAVWYDVGSKDDPAGRSGFAHLFEHIMFKSTRNMPPEFMDRLTEDAGGFNNASTWNDFTNYYETVPANHLERVLWGEADRMGSLVIDEANFKSERDVVKEELRQSVLSQPYGKLFSFYLYQSGFSVHPYGRPGIGSIADLDAATVEDVRAFHAAYYRPDNAVLVVSGNFDEGQLDGWVRKYFAGIRTPDRPIPRVTAVEPQRAGPKSYTVYEPNVPFPAAVVSWPSPPASSADTAAIILMDAILLSGESSRLYQSLVYDQQLVADVGSNLDITADPGIYALYVILSEGKTAEEGLKSLRAEIAKMRDTPVTQAELDEARNELITGYLQGRETSDGRADDLARGVILYKNPRASDELLAKLQTITAADIQRVARSIMNDARSVTISYLPEEMQNGASEATFADAATIQTSRIDIPASDIPVYTLAAEADRIAPPAAGPSVAARVPASQERTLPNGLRVIVAEKRGVPLVSASLRIGAGSRDDPRDLNGLASMTADLVTRGTTTRSATKIAQEIESLGAAIGAGAGADATDVSASMRSDKTDPVFAILADVVRNPAFAEEEVERARQETLDGLSLSLSQPSSVANSAMVRAIYGSGPYGNTPSEKSISAINRDYMRTLHSIAWKPDNAVLVISGDISPEQGFALAERAFGSWPKSAGLPGKGDPIVGAPAPRSIVVDMPKIGQAAVMMGLRGVARTDADYFPLLVANDVLGGGYSARLNAEIRIKRGLSYGARSSLSGRKDRGALVASAQTRNDAVPAVVDLISAELSRLGAEPIPAAELEARKAVLIGSFGRSVETTAGLAGQLSALAQFGLPLNRLSTYSADVQAVTVEQAGAIARKYYDPAKADLVIVGDASVFWNDLQGKRSSIERIPIDKFSLDSESLQ